MQKRYIYLIFLLAAFIIFGQGCKTTVVGPEGQTSAVYSMGTLSAEEPSSIDSVYQATIDALSKLELSISQKLKDELTAKVIARDAEDKKITVELASVTKDSTKMTIRAGSFNRASRIYQMIHESLQK
jgi:hypothetical protein